MSGFLIIGGDSTIGAALAKKLDAPFTSRRKDAALYLDLGDSPATWPDLPAAEVVYMCAAITRLDACENDPAATRRVNVEHMQALISRLQSQGSFVVFLSSNQVFDGNEPFVAPSAPTCPQNEYGRQKAAVESWLLARPQPAAVLRLTKVIATPLPILDTWKEQAARNEAIEAFDDLIFAPLPLEAVLQALEIIGREERAGISQLSGTQDISYAQLAKTISPNVKKISAASKGIPENFLPKHGTLKTTFHDIAIPDAEHIILGKTAGNA